MSDYNLQDSLLQNTNLQDSILQSSNLDSSVLQNSTLIIIYAIFISCILGFGTAGYERMMKE